MKPCHGGLICGLVAGVCLICCTTGNGQTNSWISPFPTGGWQVGLNWSLGVAPSNSHSVFITNASTKTASIDATTVLSNAINSCMTISNLTVGAPVGSANTLFLNNAGLDTPLRVRNTFTVTDRGILDINNSVLNLEKSGIFYIRGNVYLKSGAIVTTNSSALTGCSSVGTGQLTMSNGTWLAQNITVGLCASEPGALTLAGGTNWLNSGMKIGNDPGATGMVWITGGTLIVTNFPTNIGFEGIGHMTLSNGIVNAGTIEVATLPGSFGSLTVAGGTLAANQLIATNFAVVHFPGGNTTLRGTQVGTSQLISIGGAGSTGLLNLMLTGTNRFGEFAAASSVGSTGIVTLSGGVLLSTNDLFSTRIGSSGVGQMTITNSTFVVDGLVVGYTNGAQGTLSLMTGSSLQCRVLSLGSDFNSTGTVWLTGSAQLITTNGRTVLGDHGSGRLILSNGTWQADQVSVGHSIGAAGTLTIAGGTSVIGPNLVVGRSATATGTVWVTGGQLLSTNTSGANDTIIASNGMGQATISNGLIRTYTQIIGAGSAGTLTIAGGTNHVGGDLVLGKLAGATGTVWLTGGRLEVNDGFDPLVILGDSGVGRMTVSNGTWLSRYISVGGTVGGSGTLTIAGGTNICDAVFGIAMSSGATGVVWMTGGELTTTNGPARVGHVSVGQMTVSNGTWRARNLSVGAFNGGRGTLTLAGGTNLFSNLTVGLETGATGTVWMTGYQLILTNLPTVVGSNGVGQLTVSNGIVNAATLTVAQNPGSAGTLTVAGGTLTANQLVAINSGSTVQFPAGFMTLRGADVANNQYFQIGGAGQTAVLNLVGGTNRFADGFEIGPAEGSTGTVWMTDGELAVTNNGILFVANDGFGRMTVSNGTCRASTVIVGDSAGSGGTLTVAGGTNIFSSQVIIGYAVGASGAVWLTRGQLVTTNNNTEIGYNGVGQLTVSNGTWWASLVDVATTLGAQGTLTLAGGTNIFSSVLAVGHNSQSTGAVWMTGGDLIVTNAPVYVGDGAVGKFTISNGTWRARDVSVGAFSGGRGTLTVAGGNSVMSSNLILGASDCTATGIVNITAGELRVTNNTVTAVLEVRSGTLTQSGGLLQANRIVVTNSCARFIHTGGVLLTNVVILSTNLFADADGDGIDTKYEMDNGLDPLNPNDAALDNDGDGQSNLEEFTMGTNPNNAGSSFRIISIVTTNNNVLITWTVAPTSGYGSFLDYYVLWGTNLTAGITNTLSPVIAVGPGAPATTNYLDMGGAANIPPRFYRVWGFID